MTSSTYFLEDDLDNRRNQIESVIALLEELDDNSVFLSEKNELLTPTSTLINTLKSSVYLMLYNAIEATMRECIVLIHDELDDSCSKFDDLKQALKKEILTRIRKEHKNIENIIAPGDKPFTETIHKTSFEKKKLFSGNIDREEIAKISKIYGFETTSDYQKTKHGITLKDIKDKRNNLAHGNIDFVNAAKLEAVSDIRKLSEHTINYLESIIENIGDCIENKTYLEPQSN